VEPERKAVQLHVAHVLSQGFLFYFTHFFRLVPAIVAIMLVSFLAAELISFTFFQFLRAVGVETWHFDTSIAQTLGFIKILGSITAFFTAILMVKEIKLNQKLLPLRDNLKDLLHHLPRAILAFLSASFRYLGVIGIFVIGSIITVFARSYFFYVIFSLAGLFWALYLYVRFVFISFLIFEEEPDGWRIPAASSNLVQGHTWSIVLLLVVVDLILIAAHLPFEFVIGDVVSNTNIMAWGQLDSRFIIGIVYKIVQAFALVLHVVLVFHAYDQLQTIKLVLEKKKAQTSLDLD
jgi:hypothetical protein